MAQRSVSPGVSFPFPPQLAQVSLGRVSVGSFLLFNMLSTAFMAHANAVRFYNELSDRTVDNFYKVYMSLALSHSICVHVPLAISLLSYMHTP